MIRVQPRSVARRANIWASLRVVLVEGTRQRTSGSFRPHSRPARVDNSAVDMTKVGAKSGTSSRAPARREDDPANTTTASAARNVSCAGLTAQRVATTAARTLTRRRTTHLRRPQRSRRRRPRRDGDDVRVVWSSLRPLPRGTHSARRGRASRGQAHERQTTSTRAAEREAGHSSTHPSVPLLDA